MTEPSGSRYSESQEGLLRVVAALGTTLTTAKSQMLLLGMLIARLGDGCARMRATVASLLQGAIAISIHKCCPCTYVTHKTVTFGAFAKPDTGCAGLAASKGMVLHDLVLSTAGLLEWLGQHITKSHAIIGASYHHSSMCLQLTHMIVCAAVF